MLKILKNKHFVVCGLLPNFEPDISFEQYKKARGLYIEDPWERVKSIFTTSDIGEIHPELKYARQMFEVGLGVGVLYGGLRNATKRAEEYLRTNETTIFQNRKEAIKAFVNHNTLAFINGGLRWAPVFGISLGAFSLLSSCSEAYRNRPSMLDSTIAGFVIGGISRFMLGIKGMISGGVVGGTLGSIHGIVAWGLSKIGNTDQTELKYAHFAFSRYREQWKNQVSRKSDENKASIESNLHPSDVLNPLNQFDKQEEPENSIKEKNK